MTVKLVLMGLMALAPVVTLAEQGSPPANTTPKPGAPGAADSGIRGIVVRWPIKPSSRAGETNSAPMPHVTVSVQPENGGAEIAREKANENGRFEFKLPPGKYVVVPVLEPGLRFRVRNQTVEVKDKKFSEVVLSCDTGIR